jgi:hypothetical protein
MSTPPPPGEAAEKPAEMDPGHLEAAEVTQATLLPPPEMEAGGGHARRAEAIFLVLENVSLEILGDVSKWVLAKMAKIRKFEVDTNMLSLSATIPAPEPATAL